MFRTQRALSTSTKHISVGELYPLLFSVVLLGGGHALVFIQMHKLFLPGLWMHVHEVVCH